MTDERCKRCGDAIEKDELGWFCRGCDHRTTGDGRKSTRQPTKGQKALRRFKDREAAKAHEVIDAVFREGAVMEQQTLFRACAHRPKRDASKIWCTACDALMVMRVGRVMCWRCGVVWQP